MQVFHPHTQLKQDTASGVREAFVIITGLDMERFQHQSFCVIPAAFQCLALLECDMGSLPNAFAQAFFSHSKGGFADIEGNCFCLLGIQPGSHGVL